jgi:hypothetical protein
MHTARDMTTALRLILPALALLTGCAATSNQVYRPPMPAHDERIAALSAGAIGCPRQEIAISNYEDVLTRFQGTYAGEVATWSARCRGHEFYCTGSHVTQCHEALAPAANMSSP